MPDAHLLADVRAAEEGHKDAAACRRVRYAEPYPRPAPQESWAAEAETLAGAGLRHAYRASEVETTAEA